jgi:hypothetical protein
MLSKNSASSRAIPTEKLIQRVLDDPFVPAEWGKNQKGMQAGAELSLDEQQRAIFSWLYARDRAVDSARSLMELGLHKQIVNRVIEPFMWITIIVSGTTWSNVWGLRDHKDAEPHFQKITRMLRALYDASEPNELEAGEWHLPLWYTDEDAPAVSAMVNNGVEGDLSPDEAFRKIACKIAVGRCARVSYLTHDGRRDISEDIGLHDRLMNANPGHWSPFEHVARAEADPSLRSGNFQGFTQYRKRFLEEHIGGRMP